MAGMVLCVPVTRKDPAGSQVGAVDSECAGRAEYQGVVPFSHREAPFVSIQVGNRAVALWLSGP